MSVGLGPFLVLGAVLFSLGLYGAISKRSAIMVLMSLELMAAAVNVNLMAFSRFVTPKELTGQVFTIFVMAVSAAEIGLGLAIVLSLYRRSRTVELDTFDRLRG